MATFTIALKRNGTPIADFDDFDKALDFARSLKIMNPYVEIHFCCFNEFLRDGFMSKVVWTAQDDAEA